MTLFQSILLGVVQGLTEFLPVSSSAHLVLVPYLLGWELPEIEIFIFNVLVQVASLIAVIAYFWRDLTVIFSSAIRCLLQKKPFSETEARLGWLLILATIPAGLIGLSLKSFVERAFASPQITAFFLMITAGMLIAAEKLSSRAASKDEPGWRDALWIGLAQAAAIFPGISRSGSTITAGMLRGLPRQASARFGFLMSIPIMLAAGLAACVDLVDLNGSLSVPAVFIPGFIASAVVSYFSIRWMLSFVARRPLYIFAIYCFCFSSLVFIVSAVR